MNYKAVLFDMDGVIVDSEPVHEATVRTTLQKYGYNVTPKNYKDHFFGRTDEAGMKSFFDFIGQTVDISAIVSEKAKMYIDLAPSTLVACEGVVEFIHDLSKHRIPLALVTGSWRTEALLTLQTFQLSDYFSAIITAEDVMAGKPNPEGYVKGAATLGVHPTECIVIEDAPAGVAAAKAAGMRCVAVTTGHAPEELKEADRVVSRLLTGCLEGLR